VNSLTCTNDLLCPNQNAAAAFLRGNPVSLPGADLVIASIQIAGTHNKVYRVCRYCRTLRQLHQRIYHVVNALFPAVQLFMTRTPVVAPLSFARRQDHSLPDFIFASSAVQEVCSVAPAGMR